MRFFLAGIMQGSHAAARCHDQDYRAHIARLIETHFPDADVYDPHAKHSTSLDYTHETGREVFFRHNFLCREVDVLVAFVPEASMGTAIEMWEAYQHRAAVITISPLKHNWAVKFPATPSTPIWRRLNSPCKAAKSPVGSTTFSKSDRRLRNSREPNGCRNVHDFVVALRDLLAPGYFIPDFDYLAVKWRSSESCPEMASLFLLRFTRSRHGLGIGQTSAMATSRTARSA